MGLDWNPGPKAKQGFENEFSNLWKKLHRKPCFFRAQKVRRFKEITSDAFETLAAPRVGSDERADQWVREQYPKRVDIVQKLEDNITAISSSGFKDIDRELERKIAERIPDDDAIEFRLKLATDFGVSGLAENPKAIIARILKRGKLLNEIEAKLLQDYLAGDFQGFLCPPEQQKLLSSMLATFDSRPSQNK